MNWETDYNLKKESFVKDSLANLSKHELNEFNLLNKKFTVIKRKIRELKKDIAELDKQRDSLKKTKKKFNYFAIALMVALQIIVFFKDSSTLESYVITILAGLVYFWHVFSFYDEDKTLFQLMQTKEQTIELVSMPLVELGLLYIAGDEELVMRLSESYPYASDVSESDQLACSSYYIELDLAILKIVGVDVPFTFADFGN